MSEQKRRRIFIVNKKFQLGLTFSLIKLIIILVLLICLILGVIFYFKYQHGESIFTDYLLIVKKDATIKVTNMFQALGMTPLIPVILISFILITLFMIFYGIMYSHRIAGPLYRFNKVLEDISKGIIDLHTKFRKNDKFTDMAGHLNKAMEFINDSITSLKINSDALKKEINELEKAASQSPAELKELLTRIKTLKELQSNLNSGLDKFKTK